MLAAVDRQRGPRNKGRVVRYQKLHRPGDIACVTQPADRDGGDDLFKHLFWHCAHHIRIHITRRDGIDRNPFGRTFQSQCLGKPWMPDLAAA